MSDTKKVVYLDFDGVNEILKKRGRDVSLKKTASEIGYTPEGMFKMRKAAPKAIAMLHKYLKDNSLNFEDLVKEK